jgi:putative PIN family toxin of toxin-antitoxin system
MTAFVPRVVVDTNVLISSLLLAHSIPGQAMTKAEESCQLLTSTAAMEELIEVLYRPKFAKFLSVEIRREYIEKYNAVAR